MKVSSRTGKGVRRVAPRQTQVVTRARVTAVDYSQENPPHLKFVEQTQGTLPEIIKKTDLDTLNSGLGFLFALLREARRQFEQEGDNGRLGAFTALGAFWQFIVLFKAPLTEGLQLPILQLQDALTGLDSNLVSPIVKPIPRRGRAPSSHTHATLKGHAAGTVKRLVETGLSPQDAHEEVAKRLNQLGVRPERGSGSITAITVRNWCGAVSSDVGRHGTAARMFDSMFTRLDEQERFSALPKKDEARRYALCELAQWVQSLSPGLKNLPKPLI